MHSSNSFITLTYDDEHLRSSSDALRDDIQRFFKRFRKAVKKKIRYIYSVEYGEKTLRPHFHAIIFNHDFPNQKKVRVTKKGYPLFTSPSLARLWTFGHHSIGSATVKSAYYIAAYALKRHSAVNEETGEVVSDYMRCSTRPGIGLEYLKKHRQQLVDSKTPLPRYYQKKLAEIDPQLLQVYQDRLAERNFVHDDAQKYAKYKISDANPAKSELRFDGNNLDQLRFNKYLENHLKEKSKLQLQRKKND